MGLFAQLANNQVQLACAHLKTPSSNTAAINPSPFGPE